jgi:predicted PurR-regulated permease PerM
MTESRSSYGVLAASIFTVLLLLLVYSLAEVLLLLFIAALFSLYLGAVTDFMGRRLGTPRWLGLTVALVLTLGASTALVMLIVPPVLEQTHELINTMPALLAQWEASLLQLAVSYPVIGPMLPAALGTGGYFDPALERVGSYFTGLFPYLFSGLHVLINLISVLVMGIYLTLRPGLYREGMIALVPVVHRTLARDILAELANTLRSWIVGMMIAMVFLGVLTYIGLLLLEVPYALAFGVFTGVVVIVPFFGTLVSTLLPALFVLGSYGAFHALLVALLGVVVHLVEANIIHPMVMERQINLPPVLSILSVLMMAKLMGVIGIVVAVPILASVMVITRRIYVQRIVEGKGFRRAVREEELGSADDREVHEELGAEREMRGAVGVT